MTLRRTVLCLATLGLVHSSAWADNELKVVATGPAANATVTGPSEDFFVRFDKPIDHIRSKLSVKMRGGGFFEILQPRLKTEPQVLYARAPNLAPGDYTLHWSVKTLQGVEIVEGEIPFTVAPGKR